MDCFSLPIRRRIGVKRRVILEPVEEGRLRLDAGTWGTMGVGLGYAIAAAVARPERLSIAVEGDSAFGFSGMECETICRRARVGPHAPARHVFPIALLGHVLSVYYGAEMMLCSLEPDWLPFEHQLGARRVCPPSGAPASMLPVQSAAWGRNGPLCCRLVQFATPMSALSISGVQFRPRLAPMPDP